MRNSWLRWGWIAVLFACLFSSFSMGQEDSKDLKTCGFTNGRMWKNMGKYKVLWVLGYKEGISEEVRSLHDAKLYESSPELSQKLYELHSRDVAPENSTYSDFVSEIDRFYEDAGYITMEYSIYLVQGLLWNGI